MATEPDFDEQDIDDCIMDELPTGEEKFPLSKEDYESYNSLKEFFFNAWIH